jgi:hypothetical protein
MTREQAINYLFSCGFTNEQVGEVVRALTYEPTTKNDPKFCPDRKAKTTNMETILHCIENECAAYKDGKCLKYNSDQEPTTKNNLGVDCISRQALLNTTVKKNSIWNKITDSEGNNLETIISNLPSVTPQPRKGHWLHRPHVYGVAYCSICDFELKIDNTNYCPNCGAKMVEP